MGTGKILVVSVGVLPYPSASALIVDGLARHFSRDEMVIAGEWRAYPDPLPANDQEPEIHYVGREVSWPGRGRGRRFTKWTRWLKFPMVYGRLARLARREDCRVIVAVFPDEYYLALAYLLSQRHNLPLFPWFHNTYLENRRGLKRRFASWLQPRVFREAPLILTMSEGMAAFYEKHHPGLRFKPLVHGFELPDAAPAFEDTLGSPVRLAFTGTLNASCLDAATRVAQVVRDRDEYELHLYSKNPQSDFDRVGIAGRNVVYHGFVPPEELGHHLAACDVCLLAHGLQGGLSEIEYETIFPTRTISLLCSGRPVFAHTPPGSFLTQFLTKHDCAEVVDVADPAAIDEALQSLRRNRARRRALVDNAFLAVQQFQAAKVADHLRMLITAHMNETGIISKAHVDV